MMKSLIYLAVLFSVFSISSVFGTTQCDDSYDCSTSTIVDDYVYCSGNYGCYLAELDVTADLYCSGNYACYRAVIETDASNYLYCTGAYGCYLSEIAYAYYLYAYGFYGAGYAKALVSRASCHGYFGCYGASLSEGTYYYSNGYFGLAYGDIDTNGVSTTYTYLYGYYAGYDTAIYCRNGSYCTVGCSDVACYYTKLLCYSGATCVVSCDSSCASGCPTVYYVTESASLLMLNNIKADNIKTNNENGNVEYITINEAKEMIELRNEYKQEYKHQEMEKLKELKEKYPIEQATIKFGEWLDEELSKRIKENDVSVVEKQLNVDSIVSKYSGLFASNMVVLLMSAVLIIGMLIGGCTAKLYLSNNNPWSYQKI